MADVDTLRPEFLKAFYLSELAGVRAKIKVNTILGRLLSGSQELVAVDATDPDNEPVDGVVIDSDDGEELGDKLERLRERSAELRVEHLEPSVEEFEELMKLGRRFWAAIPAPVRKTPWLIAAWQVLQGIAAVIANGWF